MGDDEQHHQEHYKRNGANQHGVGATAHKESHGRPPQSAQQPRLGVLGRYYLLYG
jgi:hypothetical protein